MGRHARDIRAIVAHRHDNGADYWATPDGRLAVGHPFSTLAAVFMLGELGADPARFPLKGAVGLIMEAWREDGRFRLAPGGTFYPCYTAGAARTLCRVGLADDPRLLRTVEQLLQIQHADGGWRCLKFAFGRSPETEYSNPGTTLEALDVFRFTSLVDRERRLDRAVGFLLGHWQTRAPLGPCHFGIGSRFLKIEYPMFRYNLFGYVHVLSFYRCARRDARFREALTILQSKLVEGEVVVESPHRRLTEMTFCRPGQPSELATQRYREIVENVGAD